MHPDPVHHTIIAFDIARSSKHPVSWLLKMREDLRRITRDVLAKQGITWDSLHYDDLGDGLRLLLPPIHPAMRVLRPFVNELDAALRTHRMQTSERAPLRLRVVVHHGLAYFDGGVWAGDALVLAARLLDAEPLRRALNENPDANFALIVSEAIYKDVIVNEYGPPASAFRPVQVVVKETRTQAWIYLPETAARSTRRSRPFLRHGGGTEKSREPGRAFAIAGLLLTLTGILVSLLVPEIRCKIKLGECAMEGSPQTTGGDTNTWTDYRSGGGAPGPMIPKGTTVLVSCRTLGLMAEDGNPWWYRVSSPDWNNRYYASADAFYNNGQITGPLPGTPFVDESVPLCDE